MSGLHPIRDVLIIDPTPQPPDMGDLRDVLEQNYPLVLPTISDFHGRSLDVDFLFLADQRQLYYYDAGDTTSAENAPEIIVDNTSPTGRRYKKWSAGSSFALHMNGSGALVAWTSMPAAATLFAGVAARSIYRANLSGYRRARLHAAVSTIGASTPAYLALRYRLATDGYSATVGDYLTLGTSDVKANINATGLVSSAWIPLLAAPRTDVFLALVGQDGNGTASPQFGPIYAEFQS